MLEAVYGVAGFATKVGDFFSSDKLDIELGLMGAEGPPGAFMAPGNTTLVSAQSMDGL